MQLSDAGEAPLKMEEMVYCEAVQQRGDLEAVPGCCKQLKLHTVVSARKRIYRCGIQNLISAGAKNRRQGGKGNTTGSQRSNKSKRRDGGDGRCCGVCWRSLGCRRRS